MKQIKMKASKELLNHLSANVGGVTAEGFRTILEAYKGEVEETPPTKHPIELVNEKYPNGWYCEAFEELIQDVKQADGCDEDWDYPLIGWNFVGARNYNASYEGNETIRLSSKKITSTEYLSITRPQQEQPLIHVQLPPESEQSHIIETLQSCVNDLDARIKQLEAMQAPNKGKKNLDTQGEEWKNNECLSWNDLVYWDGDNKTLEEIIKKKLKK